MSLKMEAVENEKKSILKKYDDLVIKMKQSEKEVAEQI